MVSIKVLVLVSKKLVIEFFCFWPLSIYFGPQVLNFSMFLYGIGLKKIGIDKSIGISFEKIWYRKSIGFGIEKNWYRKKVSDSDFGFRHTLIVSTITPGDDGEGEENSSQKLRLKPG